jgi:polyisoprenyl-phosphate glycosyltransferase
MLLLSVVIPVCNEEDALPLLLDRLSRVLTDLEAEFEVLLVDDGSTDRSLEIASRAAALDPRYKVLAFSRNFGHQAAITAGLDFADGDAVAVMDADLQDPPELLPTMLERYREGFEVVSAQRRTRAGESPLKRATADAFYRFMRIFADARLRPQVGDFRLLSREAVRAVRAFRERRRFLRGIIAWLGLKEAIVLYDRAPRAAGASKYSPAGMLRFSWTALSSFSTLPLRLTALLGALLTAGGLAYWALASWGMPAPDPGPTEWTAALATQAVLSGLTLLGLGVVGDYVAGIYEEVKNRPLYVVSELRNLDPAVAPPRAIVLHAARVEAATRRG